MRKALGSFAIMVQLGLAAAVIVTVAGSHRWVDYQVKPAGIALVGSDIGEVPLAAALGFVLLAAWGVLLVTRGQVRRAFAIVGLLATLGLVVCVGYALTVLPGDVRGRFPTDGYTTTTSYSGWFWAALVAVLVSLVATASAGLHAPLWPAMGRRYDAPGSEQAGSAAPTVDARDPDADNRELWKAIDEGRDPTDTDPRAV